jgi:cytochrome c biogenesis protein CcmG, thiol:disulfide interchange protein DsbE
MNRFSKYLPFFMLVFFISIIGLSTYKINAKQQIGQKDLSADVSKITTNFFSKENILLPEFSLPDLYDENKHFSDKDLKGKYSLINFFASWCTTCHAEHEVLLRLKSEGIIDMYGVAWRDIDDNTKSYLKESGNPFTQVASDNRAIFTKIIGIKAVPETLIVNPEGRVVLRYQGNLEDYAISEIRDFLLKVR